MQMRIWSSSKHAVKILVAALAALVISMLLIQIGGAARRPPLFPADFLQANVQGFGDRQNSWSWSMKWWGGKLYVGTNRAWQCVETAATVVAYPDLPFLEYPKPDPDIVCTESPQDLPVQAEIWRYTPETTTWERVFQSPNDVEIPDHPGKYVARDIGFRGMTSFTEQDGTEALYVSGINSYGYNPGVPPPRILRSTDGQNFEPVPQDPGTLLGDLGYFQCCFREMSVYNGRLYVTNGSMQGGGALLEAENPAGGNDNFRQVVPEEMNIMAHGPYNGYLYVAISNLRNGFTLAKTDTTGTPPYELLPVIPDGGFLRPSPSKQALSLEQFQGLLYVGTDKPAEIYRVNPDDTWELIVGTPRETPDGWKYPLSGMDRGFDYWLNAHMWRMQTHEGQLYVGTVDQSTVWRNAPVIGDLLRPNMGFDLYTTRDGWYYTMITRTGFDSIFDYGIRTFASTPHGLFFGTANEYYGTRVWQGVSKDVHLFFFPLIPTSGNDFTVAGRRSQAAGHRPQIADAGLLAAPERLEVETGDDAVVLSWEPPRGATRFRIYRSTFTAPTHLGTADLGPDAWVPGPFEEVGTTELSYFSDTPALDGDRFYHYYVLAEDGLGGLSAPSNLVRAPSLAPAVTFDRVKDSIAGWASRNPAPLNSAAAEGRSALEDARGLAKLGRLEEALQRVESLRGQAAQGQLTYLPAFRVHDAEVLLARLARRIQLAQAGILPSSALNSD